MFCWKWTSTHLLDLKILKNANDLKMPFLESKMTLLSRDFTHNKWVKLVKGEHKQNMTNVIVPKTIQFSGRLSDCTSVPQWEPRGPDQNHCVIGLHSLLTAVLDRPLKCCKLQITINITVIKSVLSLNYEMGHGFWRSLKHFKKAVYELTAAVDF